MFAHEFTNSGLDSYPERQDISVQGFCHHCNCTQAVHVYTTTRPWMNCICFYPAQKAETPQKWVMIPHCRQWYRGWDTNKDLHILIYLSVCLTIYWIVCLITPRGCFDISWVVVSPGNCQNWESAWQVVFRARRYFQKMQSRLLILVLCSWPEILRVIS